tara:strand:- start:471 stop:611 length:141 start_codon:yes stop_codon:yes gene_type:complete
MKNMKTKDWKDKHIELLQDQIDQFIKVCDKKDDIIDDLIKLLNEKN